MVSVPGTGQAPILSTPGGEEEQRKQQSRIHRLLLGLGATAEELAAEQQAAQPAEPAAPPPPLLEGAANAEAANGEAAPDQNGDVTANGVHAAVSPDDGANSVVGCKGPRRLQSPPPMLLCAAPKALRIANTPCSTTCSNVARGAAAVLPIISGCGTGFRLVRPLLASEHAAQPTARAAGGDGEMPPLPEEAEAAVPVSEDDGVERAEPSRPAEPDKTDSRRSDRGKDRDRDASRSHRHDEERHRERKRGRESDSHRYGSL